MALCTLLITVIWPEDPDSRVKLKLTRVSGSNFRKSIGSARATARATEQRTERAAREMAFAFYQVLAALLGGGDDGEWSTFPGRIMRLGLLFAILILFCLFSAQMSSSMMGEGFEIKCAGFLVEKELVMLVELFQLL